MIRYPSVELGDRARPGAGRRLATFYTGAGDRSLVKCPDCGEPADALFSDHGGSCVDGVAYPSPASALGVIRRLALTSSEVSPALVGGATSALKSASVAAALASAERRGWLEADGETWRSLIVGQHMAVTR